jgi:hypothetical protein
LEAVGCCQEGGRGRISESLWDIYHRGCASWYNKETDLSQEFVKAHVHVNIDIRVGSVPDPENRCRFTRGVGSLVPDVPIQA